LRRFILFYPRSFTLYIIIRSTLCIARNTRLKNGTLCLSNRSRMEMPSIKFFLFKLWNITDTCSQACASGSRSFKIRWLFLRSLVLYNIGYFQSMSWFHCYQSPSTWTYIIFMCRITSTKFHKSVLAHIFSHILIFI